MSPQEMIDYKENVDKLSKEELVKEYCKLSRLIAKWNIMNDSWKSCYISRDINTNSFKSTMDYLEEKMFIVQHRMYHTFEGRMLPNEFTIPLDCFNNNFIILGKELIKIINKEKYYL